MGAESLWTLTEEKCPSVVALGLGSRHTRTMQRFTLRPEDGIEPRIKRSVSHLHLSPLYEAELNCQMCGTELSDSDQITLYLYRSAGGCTYTIGQCRCRNHNEDLKTLFTLGLRELIVDGRIGQFRDPTTEETWPVLLTPSIRLISAGDTKSGRRLTDHSQRPPHAGDHQSTPTPNGDPSAQATGIKSATQPLNRMPVVVEETDPLETAIRSGHERRSTETTEDDH